MELIDVDYDPLPVVTDPEAALTPGTPLTHPELGTNISYTHSLSGGDIDDAFRRADRVIKQRVATANPWESLGLEWQTATPPGKRCSFTCSRQASSSGNSRSNWLRV